MSSFKIVNIIASTRVEGMIDVESLSQTLKAQYDPEIFPGLVHKRKSPEAKINKYGFLHFGKLLMEAWNLSKGAEQPVIIELNAEGALIIRKSTK